MTCAPRGTELRVTRRARRLKSVGLPNCHRMTTVGSPASSSQGCSCTYITIQRRDSRPPFNGSPRSSPPPFLSPSENTSSPHWQRTIRLSPLCLGHGGRNLPAPPLELAAGAETSLSKINGRGEPLAASKARLMSMKRSHQCFVHQATPFCSCSLTRFPNDSRSGSHSTLRRDHRERTHETRATLTCALPYIL